MKFIRVLFAAIFAGLALTISGFAAAEGWLDDYDQALAQARAEKKLVLVLFTSSDTLPSCKKLASEVFATKDFKEFAAKNYVLLEVDFPRSIEQSKQLKERNRDLNARIGGRTLPIIVIVDGEGKEQGRFIGYDGKGAKVLIAKLQAYRE